LDSNFKSKTDELQNNLHLKKYKRIAYKAIYLLRCFTLTPPTPPPPTLKRRLQLK